VQQISGWLKTLGMSEFAERFAENDIDMAVLPDLTDQHLKDLGVSLGHRLKMLRAAPISTALRLPFRHLRHPWRPSQLGKTTTQSAAS